MKFDCIIGNPPYVDGVTGKSEIYSKFYNKAKAMADVVAMITPSTLFKSKQAPDNLYYIKDSTDYFNIVLQTCAFIVTKEPNDNFICNNHTLKKRSIVIFDKVLSGIVNKIDAVDHYVFKRLKRRPSVNPIKTVDVINTNKLTYTTSQHILCDNESYYVINSYMKNSNPWLAATKIIEPGITIPDKYRAIKCKTKLEAESVYSQLTSKLYMYVQQQTLTGRSLDGPQTKFCKILDKSRVWTDEELYDHFGLTEEERNEIRLHNR